MNKPLDLAQYEGSIAYVGGMFCTANEDGSIPLNSRVLEPKDVINIFANVGHDRFRLRALNAELLAALEMIQESTQRQSLPLTAAIYATCKTAIAKAKGQA